LRVVLQRVRHASVEVDGTKIAEIGAGLLLLVGVTSDDDDAVAARMAQKCAEMRIFSDDAGKFDASLIDTGGEALVVSQFTLLADVRKGRRPSFLDAADPAHAAPLVDAFVAALRGAGVRVATGVFGASMQVTLLNDGPVTIIVDSRDLERPRRA
jgi:D-tyrosyl-tRNA(Tyr) deacylase